MTLLAEIPSFPKSLRKILETRFGITSAEAFFEHSERNASGIGTALQVPANEVERLRSLVEAHLPPAFIARSRQPVQKHARGVIVE